MLVIAGITTYLTRLPMSDQRSPKAGTPPRSQATSPPWAMDTVGEGEPTVRRKTGAELHERVKCESQRCVFEWPERKERQTPRLQEGRPLQRRSRSQGANIRWTKNKFSTRQACKSCNYIKGTLQPCRVVLSASHSYSSVSLAHL